MEPCLDEVLGNTLRTAVQLIADEDATRRSRMRRPASDAIRRARDQIVKNVLLKVCALRYGNAKRLSDAV
jgi:hypothetical protein